MKLKVVQKSATVAWSPIQEQRELLVAGTVSGSIDTDFDTSSSIELFSLGNLSLVDDPPIQLGSAPAQERFSKVAWSKPFTSTTGEFYSLGVVAGGHGNGAVSFWNPSTLLDQASSDGAHLNSPSKLSSSGDMSKSTEGPSALIRTEKHHTKAVHSVAFNPFQNSLLATCSNSELLIWDLQKLSKPIPVLRGEHITSIAWNCMVQRILAVANADGNITIWDLKAQKSIFNLPDESAEYKYRCRALAWHPNEATILATASENDKCPVIQIWDLRQKMSPLLRTLSGHTKGIWSLSWCPHDPNWLLSCSKDNKIFCWNLSTGKIAEEIRMGCNFNYNVQWADHIPSVLSASSLEKQVNIASLHDVGYMADEEEQHVDSSDPFAELSPAAIAHPSMDHPPSWLGRRAGASFAFGGRLVSFSSATDTSIQITSVPTDESILERSMKLQTAIEENSLRDYCEQRAEAAIEEDDRNTWTILAAQCCEPSRDALFRHLGLDPQRILERVHSRLDKLPQIEVADLPDVAEEEDNVVEENEEESEEGDRTPGDKLSASDRMRTLLMTDESAAKLAIEENAVSISGGVGDLFGGDDSNDAFGDAFGGGESQENDDDPFGSAGGASAQGEDDFFSTMGDDTPKQKDAFSDQISDQRSEFDEEESTENKVADSLPSESGSLGTAESGLMDSSAADVDPRLFQFTSAKDTDDELIAQAVISGNLAAIVEFCERNGNWADALVLSRLGGEELHEQVHMAYLDYRRDRPYIRLAHAISTHQMYNVTKYSDIAAWKETLAILLTFTKGEETKRYANVLGERLSKKGLLRAASLCFICAGNMGRVLRTWSRLHSNNTTIELVNLMERLIVLKHCLGPAGALPDDELPDHIVEKYCQYAFILANQGQGKLAARFLSFASHPKFQNTFPALLLDRVFHSLPVDDVQELNFAPPTEPFTTNSPAAMEFLASDNSSSSYMDQTDSSRRSAQTSITSPSSESSSSAADAFQNDDAPFLTGDSWGSSQAPADNNSGTWGQTKAPSGDTYSGWGQGHGQDQGGWGVEATPQSNSWESSDKSHTTPQSPTDSYKSAQTPSSPVKHGGWGESNSNYATSSAQNRRKYLFFIVHRPDNLFYK